MSTLPEVRVGDPIRHEALAVFPLFSAVDLGVDYLLSDEAIQAGSVTVEEISEGGSVPNLLVTNQGDSRVLFLEGEELRGAKQNRVLNTSVLVAAHSKTPDPGQLRRAGPMAVPDEALRLGRLALVLEAAAYPQEVVVPVDEGGSRIHLRPDGGLERGQSPDGLAGLVLRDDGDGRHLRPVPGTTGRVPGAPQVHRGGDRDGRCRRQRRSLRWTCSTSPRRVRRSGTGC